MPIAKIHMNLKEVQPKYIECVGTGTRDMILRCREAVVPEPVFDVSTGIFTTTIQRKVSVYTHKTKTGHVTGPGESPKKFKRLY